jgi:hypothetical protein
MVLIQVLFEIRVAEFQLVVNAKARIKQTIQYILDITKLQYLFRYMFRPARTILSLKLCKKTQRFITIYNYNYNFQTEINFTMSC